MVGEFSNPPCCAPNPKHSPLVKGGLHPLWHCEEDNIHSPTTLVLKHLPSPSESGEDSTTAPIGKKVDPLVCVWGWLTIAWFLLLHYMSDWFSEIVCALVSSDVYVFDFRGKRGVWTMRLRIPFIGIYEYIDMSIWHNICRTYPPPCVDGQYLVCGRCGCLR